MVKSELHQGQELPIDGEGTPPYQRRYRWVMLALIWLLYWGFGVVVRSLAPLVTPILEDLNISYSQMGLIMGAWPLSYVPVAIIGGVIMDKWGLRKALFAGITIIALSAALRYFANGFPFMFFCVLLFGVGGPMISIGAPKIAAMWFRGKERGIAIGIYGLGSRIGGLIVYAITNSVVMPLLKYSWRLTFVVYGLVAFSVGWLWWFLCREAITESEKKMNIVEVFRALIRLRNVQLILIIGFLEFSLSHGMNDWLPKLLETGGLSPAVAGFAASIPYLAGIPAVLIIAPLVPHHLRGRILALMCFLLSISVMMVAMGKGATLVTGLVFYGILVTPIMPLMVLFLMDMPEIGSKYMGSVGGMFFCVSEIGGFAGPFIIGALVDLTGSFVVGMGVIAGISLAKCVLSLMLKTKPASDTEASP